MLYNTLTIKGTDYKLRLNTRATIVLEKRIKKNPLMIFAAFEQGHPFQVEDLFNMLYCSLLPYHDGMTEEKVMDLIDDFIEEGGSALQLADVLAEVVLKAGYMPKAETAQAEANEEAKN